VVEVRDDQTLEYKHCTVVFFQMSLYRQELNETVDKNLKIHLNPQYQNVCVFFFLHGLPVLPSVFWLPS